MSDKIFEIGDRVYIKEIQDHGVVINHALARDIKDMEYYVEFEDGSGSLWFDHGDLSLADPLGRAITISDETLEEIQKSIDALEEPAIDPVESDTGFKKFDNGKPSPTLVEPAYILGTAEVLGFGANKYGRDNWKLNRDKTRIIDALLRHIYAYQGGELTDPESGIHHLLHASCNLMFLHYIDSLPEEEK